MSASGLSGVALAGLYDRGVVDDGDTVRFITNGAIIDGMVVVLADPESGTAHAICAGLLSRVLVPAAVLHVGGVKLSDPAK